MHDPMYKRFDWRWWFIRVEGYREDVYDDGTQWSIDITLGGFGFDLGFYTCY